MPKALKNMGSLMSNLPWFSSLSFLILFFQLAIPATIIYLLYKIYRNTQKNK